MDAKYYQEKPPPEEEKLDNEFKARLPKKLEHVVSIFYLYNSKHF
jgi:hypothetical protein